MRGQLQTDVQRAEGLLMTKVIDVNAALAPKSPTLGPKSPKRSTKGGKHKNKGSKGKHTVMTTHQGGPALETHEEAPSTFVRVTVKGEAHCTTTIAATTAPRWHASFAFDVDAEESDEIVYEVVSKAGGAEEVVGVVTIPFGKIWDGAVPLGAPHALLPPGAAAADPLASVGTLYFDCAWAEAPAAPPLVAQPAAAAKSAAAATTTAAAAAAAQLPPPEFGAGTGDLIDWGAAKLAGPRPSVLRVESYYAAAKKVYGTVAHLPLVKMVSPIWEGVLESILQRTPLKPEHGAPEEGAEGHGTRVVDSIDRQIEGALSGVDELVDRKKDEALSSICNAKNVIKDIRPVETVMTTAGATRGAVGDAVHGTVASVQGFIAGIVDKVHGTAHSAADAVLHAASDATGAAAHAADTVKRAAGAAVGSAVDTVRSTVGAKPATASA